MCKLILWGICWSSCLFLSSVSMNSSKVAFSVKSKLLMSLLDSQACSLKTRISLNTSGRSNCQAGHLCLNTFFHFNFYHTHTHTWQGRCLSRAARPDFLTVDYKHTHTQAACVACSHPPTAAAEREIEIERESLEAVCGAHMTPPVTGLVSVKPPL